MESKKVKLEDMLPVITEKLSAGGTVQIPITGTSMLPLLVQGRDTVVLSNVKLPLKKFDLPLYRRNDGHFVLHRVIGVDNGKYIMCGDNQWIKESGIDDSQIIGKVTTINRKGKTIDVNSFSYKSYCRFWWVLMPIRKYLVAIRGKFAG